MQVRGDPATEPSAAQVLGLGLGLPLLTLLRVGFLGSSSQREGSRLQGLSEGPLAAASLPRCRPLPERLVSRVARAISPRPGSSPPGHPCLVPPTCSGHWVSLVCPTGWAAMHVSMGPRLGPQSFLAQPEPCLFPQAGEDTQEGTAPGSSPPHAPLPRGRGRITVQHAGQRRACALCARECRGRGRWRRSGAVAWRGGASRGPRWSADWWFSG